MVALEMTSVPPPLKIGQIMRACWELETLRSGIHLDVFGRLADSPQSADTLAGEIGADRRGVELLLDALVTLEFLENKNGIYELAEVSRLYLVAGSQFYLGESVIDPMAFKAWGHLTESIKSGKPALKEDKSEKFFPALAARIYPQNYGCACLLAKEMKVDELPAGTQVLDVAAGSGAWSLPFAEQNHSVHVDALDFPAVLEVTRRFAEKHGVASQFSYISGNWSDCKLEAEHYDIVVLGHILHSEGKIRSQALLAQANRCLKPGGRLVIAEMLADRDRPPSAFNRLFALNMLVQTDEGCVFSEDELREMLAELGLKDVIRPKLRYWEIESPILIVSKPCLSI